ncbi:MAG: NAD(P)H-quinone oxidoreductase [Dokdonella sp.]
MSDIPESMKYIEHGAGGKPDGLEMASQSVPKPKPGEVLIRVAYAGVNRPDVSQRLGKYPPPAGASPILGLEVSGTIVALGDEVDAWNLHDKVCALANGGGYAEYTCVPAGQVLPVPRGLSLQQAAALPENYFTVWTNVFERGRLAAGETFLVHGGSSGIGMTAIQLAKARGATVYTTVGNAAKAQACLRHGADAAIVYRAQDFVAEIARLTDHRGVDLILDMVGGDYVARNLTSLAMDGRLVQIAFLKSARVEVDWSPIMIRRLTYTGSTLRPRTDAQKKAIANQLLEQVWPMLERGDCLPLIHRVFSLSDAGAAHALMESSEHIGKILLEVAGE